MKPKYKVGQTVQLIASPEIKVFVLEITQQTCYAQCEQNWYTGRVIYSGKHRVVGKMERFSEIELQELVQPSKALQKMEAALEVLKKEKMALIKSQDFEKAAEIRNKINEEQLKVELQREVEGIEPKYPYMV